MSTMFDADHLARGWISVAIAAANDKERPQLHRTVLLELYPEGVRITATDSYVLLTTFVVAAGHNVLTTDVPGFDEAPVASAIAMDPHGRGLGLLGHLLALAARAAKNDEMPPEVRLSLGVMESEDDDTGRPTFDGFEVPWVVLEHPDNERVKLRTYEGSYPQYRGLMVGHQAKRTSKVDLAPDLIGRLAKLGKLHREASLSWTFCGGDKPVRLSIQGIGAPLVEGLVMPVRTEPRRDDEAES